MAEKSAYRSEAGEKEIQQLYDAALAGWPVPHDDLDIPTRHGRTFVIASGKKTAPPLLLLHGIASNAVSWSQDIPVYSRSFRVYAVDIPGDPGRSAPGRLSLIDHAQAEWLDDLLHGLKIIRTNLLGISLGGWTALRYATCYPEKVARLVILTPAGVAPVRVAFLVRAGFLSLLGPHGLRSINRLTFNQNSVHPATARFMDAVMTHFNTRVNKLHTFTDEELSRLTMPTLLVGGLKDVIQDVEKIARRLKKLVPGLSARIYPDKGHVLTDLAPDILPFLTSELKSS